MVESSTTAETTSIKVICRFKGQEGPRYGQNDEAMSDWRFDEDGKTC